MTYCIPISSVNKSCNHWKNQETIDNSQIPWSVFLDLQKAFDTVDHEFSSQN